ncbi:MAG TPA: HEAT repeat domain-containing protein, partial [Vicinamibacterales bacterium]|nr:HEAT repeat domain-containing protein [Vicinamibacterales bacterium]
MSSKTRQALAVVLAAGLIPAVASSQALLPPTESNLSRNPALISDWEDRLLAEDPKVRATAEAALVQGERRSVPLLKRLIDGDDDDLDVATFKIIQRIGPPAIPLLADLLQHAQDSIRRRAVSELIDLAPHTDSIQPALRGALTDADSVVAGD